MLSFRTGVIVLAAFGLTLSSYAADLAGCQHQLEQSLCYTPDVEHWALDTSDLKEGLRRYQERQCQPMPPKIKQTMLSVYQQYPREIQQAFCEIKRVFIVSGDVDYGGRADYYFDVSTVKIQPGSAGPRFNGKPTGFILELSEKNRFKGESASAYFTRVLRARFGNAGQPQGLPEARFDDPFGGNGALATTIVHEIGHLLGRAQKVTSTYFLPLAEGPWSKLSFKLDATGDYVLRHATPEFDTRMSFKMLDAAEVASTFALFRKAGIATLYGGTNPQEDFAEFFMLYHFGNLKWFVQGKQIFDLKAEMASNTSFKAKKEIIRSYLNLPQPFSLKNRGTVSGEIGPM